MDEPKAVVSQLVSEHYLHWMGINEWMCQCGEDGKGDITDYADHVADTIVSTLKLQVQSEANGFIFNHYPVFNVPYEVFTRFVTPWNYPKKDGKPRTAGPVAPKGCKCKECYEQEAGRKTCCSGIRPPRRK